MSGCTLPFSENDVLKITDTYENYDPKTGLYLWHAMKTVEGGVIREGSIPAEQRFVPPLSIYCSDFSCFVPYRVLK